jgi:C-terminal processing protease CtpA/Prc
MKPTVGAANLFTCWLRSAHRVITIGSTTHGNLSGIAAYAVLPCGLIVRISNGYVCDANNRPIEVNVPDISVEPSVDGYLSGRDPVLDRALTELCSRLR